MHLTDREKEELKRLIDAGEPLPAKYKLRLFADAPEVELIWQGKTSAVTSVVLPFQFFFVHEMFDRPEIHTQFTPHRKEVVFPGDCLEFLSGIPDASFQLVVTSPPYNLGKEYERRLHLDDYVAQQRAVIRECVRVLKPTGSICWQVGNYVHDGAIIPLDAVLFPIFGELGLCCRNRIVWHFDQARTMYAEPN